MNRNEKPHARLLPASLFLGVLVAGILAHTDTALARAYRSRTVHRRGVTRSRTVYRSGAAYGGSVRYSSRTVVRRPVVAPVRRTLHAARHVVHRVGHILTALPRGYATVRVRGVAYYSYGGVYYARRGSGYVVVGPPVGVVVTYLPSGYKTVWVGGVTYYTSAGVHYQPFYQGTTIVYRVVRF